MFWSVIISEIFGSVSRTLIDFWIAEKPTILPIMGLYISDILNVSWKIIDQKSLFANDMKNQQPEVFLDI